MYADEQRAESAKVAGMRADNADSHDIQHAVSRMRVNPPPPYSEFPHIAPVLAKPELLVLGQINNRSARRRMSWPKQ